MSRFAALAFALFALAGPALANEEQPRDLKYVTAPSAPRWQSAADADIKSAGCQSCHSATDHKTMHANPAIVLGCTDCHGGNAQVFVDPGTRRQDAAYRTVLNQAHVQPRYPKAWDYPSSANPEISYALLNNEAPEFVRFVNPGDYRVARESCGACHLPIIEAAERSLMSNAAMFFEGASYNNGILPFKRSVVGEAYTRDGQAAMIADPSGTPDENMVAKGVLAKLFPLPPWEVVPPADIFRIFERGGRNIGSLFPETGLPDAKGLLQNLEEPGRPDFRQSNRGPGTGNRIAVPAINLTKTRLNDPYSWFLGTNDQPGDYRSSGCSGCHVIYANDRDPLHSGPYAQFGNGGTTQTVDPTIPRDQPGHPLRHAFTRAIPTSQCMVCHMHQPNIFLNSMLGYTMWDYESDAPLMWPEKQRYPTDTEIRKINSRNPEEAAIRGKWSDPGFLKNVWTNVNPKAKDTQFADYHGHGWNFRAIFKRDRKGVLLDKDGGKIADDDPHKFDPENPHKAVQLMSVHVEKGMQCTDCHFAQDVHGNGHIYGEVAQAIEIDCQDCHGTVDQYPTLRTSGPAAPAPQCPSGSTLQAGTSIKTGNIPGLTVPAYVCTHADGTQTPAPPAGTDLAVLRTQDGRKRFEWRNHELWQRSAVTPNLEWRVHLVKDTVTPESKDYNAKAARAKLMSRDTETFAWGSNVAPGQRAHQDSEMTCISCHSSWTTSCFGCHLPIQANWKTPRNHFEGDESRNYATYNPQVARDDFFMLGKHGPAKGYRVTPIRSSSALVLSSTNANREHIYVQQPPVAASGFSSQAFAPHYPHTERTVETKTCSDCHLSNANDNNAWMASLLGLGTSFVNFVGYHAYTGLDGGIAAVQVTEWDEPQAVIGSYLHRYAYPDWYAKHEANGHELQTAHTHATGDAVGCLQLRGEYLYVAQGKRGMQAYDVASIGNKGVSEKIITAPFSPLGHDTHISSENATCVALPTNQPMNLLRNTPRMQQENQEQAIHPIYHYALITDSVEGLILTNVDTLQDGEPRNNFLTRQLTFNPGGLLRGARHLTVAGDWVYVAADAGLIVLNLADPLSPKVAATLPIQDLRATFVQFRYLFAATGKGLQVVDITHPDAPRLIENAAVPLGDAHRVYVARTFAYVAAGAQGLAIVDVENPEKPKLHQLYTADGKINDAHDVVIGSTNASLFAYVADGRNGLHVLQLTAPDTQPKFYGFSPDPKPVWIAHFKTAQPALSLSKGLERDRAVDETGGQIAVFGRIGSRPFNAEEMQRLYLKLDGAPWFVRDEVEQPVMPRHAPTTGAGVSGKGQP
ncbi:MAG: hypothetical protein E6R07_13685 [Nevskiaceae bacterium]|nr:MAG: hypothetical protein E6R07_13685 [Nevskiaceae bacterium]